MSLPRIFRTSIFRLTLLYAGLFSLSVLVLFVAIFWFGSGYVESQIDQSVTNELAEIQSRAAFGDLDHYREVIDSYVERAPSGVYYVLENSGGEVLAGNMQGVEPVVGIQSFALKEPSERHPGEVLGVRGRGIQVAGDGYLYVGLDNFELIKMREMIAGFFLWGFAATISLAIMGGFLMSQSLLRSVEAISSTSREIVAGDLSQRVPVRGVGDEFDHLASSLNTMLDRITGLMESMRQVSSDIAHDLRTPLSRLRQRLELARRREDSVEQLHQALDRSIEDVDAILDTFTALLRIAQIEAHTNAIGLSHVDLSEVLNEMGEVYQSVAEERGQRLEVSIPDGLIVLGDRELLPQLFSNLTENAIRHCPAGAKIRIDALRVIDGIVVSVSDNGAGIPPEFRTKVFQRFFQMDSSRTNDGTGLGLSLVAAIASLHHASIELLDNHPGLRVKLKFPLLNAI